MTLVNLIGMVKHRIDLVKLLKDLKLPLIGAELGCAEGYFSNDLLEQGLEKLYMVDAWQTLPVKGDGGFPQDWHDGNFNAALKRVEKHGSKAVVLRGMTTEMAKGVEDNSLGLLYLDAGHDYVSVKNDLIAWFPKLIYGGVCAGHDYLNTAYGVRQAVNDFTGKKVFVIEENKKEDAGFLFIK